MSPLRSSSLFVGRLRPAAWRVPRIASLPAVRALCVQPPKQQYTDINNETWVHRLLPVDAWPYAQLGRWDRPIGTWLLLWPCMWSTALAAPAGSLPDASLLALFGVGAFAMRGAGCTINDMWDRDIDRQVERTRSRPLASGALSMPQAFGFLGVQLSAGLGVLLALPPQAVLLGLGSVPLFSLYPLAKRFTNWPQAVLGLTFNWGALMGWAAVHGSVAWEAVLPLYVGGAWWTLMYDTIYAHQDKADDAKVGVKSSALALGDDRTGLWLFGGAAVGSFGLAAASVDLHQPAYLGLLAAGAAHLGWQVATVDLDCRADCLRKFQSNHHFGALLFAAIVAGKLLLPQAPSGDDDGAGSSGAVASAERLPPPSVWRQLRNAAAGASSDEIPPKT